VAQSACYIGWGLWVAGRDWRKSFRALPGSFPSRLVLADADNFFRVEMPALSQWRFTRDDANRTVSRSSHPWRRKRAPVFPEIHMLVQAWFPQAKAVTIPRAGHMLRAVEHGRWPQYSRASGRARRCVAPQARSGESRD
jgi:hypothetical protein